MSESEQRPAGDEIGQDTDSTTNEVEPFDIVRGAAPVGSPKRGASQGKLLDETTRREILAIISVGCSVTTAAKYVGCSPVSIILLKQRCPEFQEAMLQAEARHEISLVRRIHQAADGQGGWRAAAWLLARAYPERYAARAAETVTPKQVADSMEFFAGVIADEVKDADVRRRLRNALRIVVRKVTFEGKEQPDA
jgi:hypothetical protein